MTYDKTYSEVIDYLNDNFAYFATDVLNLGKPEYTNSVDTAAVAITSDDGDKFTNFSFLFNKDFLDGFKTVDEKAFIFAHETLHILLDHLRLAGTFADFDKIKDLAEKKDDGSITDDELAKMLVEQKKMMCFNYAADCVINDMLVNEGFTPPDIGLMRGMEQVGHDCSNYTVREVYNELMQKYKDQQPEDMQSANGEGSIDSHDWMFQQSKKEIDAAKKLYEDLKASGQLSQDMIDAVEQGNGGKRYSLTAQDVMQDFVDVHGVSMEWMKLLERINPDVFKMMGIGPPQKASFHKYRRKLGAFEHGAHLPVKRVDPRTEGETDKVPALVIALDTSGSIAQADRNKFVTLARSVPQKKIKLFPITFTTHYKELDLENPQYNSGGTCFSCIQDYIQTSVIPVLGHYPTAVVVVTDGEADFSYGNMPSEKEFKNWFWLLTDYNQKHYINQWTKDQDELISKFVKR